MKYFTLNSLKENYTVYLLNEFHLTKEKAESFSCVFDTEDIIHKVDTYMSEYIDEVTVNDQTYLHYHCWFEDEYHFTHETYYLKEDVKDKTVESYIRAHKLYSI